MCTQRLDLGSGYGNGEGRCEHSLSARSYGDLLPSTAVPLDSELTPQSWGHFIVSVVQTGKQAGAVS